MVFNIQKYITFVFQIFMMKPKELTTLEWELISAIRNYKKSKGFHIGKDLEWFVYNILDELLDED